MNASLTRTARRARVLAVLAVAVGLSAGSALPAAAAPVPTGSVAASAATSLEFIPLASSSGQLPARASVGANCTNGRCTVTFSRAETAALARGVVPAPPAFVPAPIKAGYYAFAYAHRWFAGQYAARGWCSGFRLSIYPWESQGYFGYSC